MNLDKELKIFTNITYENSRRGRNHLLRTLPDLPVLLRLEALQEAERRGIDIMPSVRRADGGVDSAEFARHNGLVARNYDRVLWALIEVRLALGLDHGLMPLEGSAP